METQTVQMVAGSISSMLFVTGSLPFGPIWLLHSFYTVTMVMLLLGYLRYARD